MDESRLHSLMFSGEGQETYNLFITITKAKAKIIPIILITKLVIMTIKSTLFIILAA